MYHNSLDAEIALFWLAFTTVGVLYVPREIGFYNSERAESPKGGVL